MTKKTSPAQTYVVRPSPDQWQTLRDLKIRSLKQEPTAFADPNPEREKYEQRTEDEWRAILSGEMSGGRPGKSIALFTKDENDYAGLVIAIIPKQGSRRLVATVQHIFIDKNHCRKGLGESLLRTLMVLNLKQSSRKVVKS